MRILIVLLLLSVSACANMNQKGDKQEAARANTDLGVEYMNQGQNDRALQKLEKALQQDPNLGAAHAAIAILYTRLDEFELADKHYRRAAFLEPNNSTFNNNYGAFLCADNQVDKAVKYFQKVLDDPAYSAPEDVLTNMGMCLRRKPDLAGAEANFRKALERNPRYPKALSQMAMVSYQQGDFLQARAFLQRYESVTRPTRDMLVLGMRLEKRLGNDEASAAYARRLRNTYPGSREPYAEALEN